MRLNELKPAAGSQKEAKRVGRGIGCGNGKTCGRGHKGQKSRSGGSVRPGFEGGQMPLQKRLPKFGFTSRIGRVTQDIRLDELMSIEASPITVEALKAENLISHNIQRVKVFLAGELSKPVQLEGIAVTKGARAAIEAAGGSAA